MSSELKSLELRMLRPFDSGREGTMWCAVVWIGTLKLVGLYR